MFSAPESNWNLSDAGTKIFLFWLKKMLRVCNKSRIILFLRSNFLMKGNQNDTKLKTNEKKLGLLQKDCTKNPKIWTEQTNS